MNINVCARQCVDVHGDVNLGVLKKNENMLIHLSLLTVYAAVPALCCVLSSLHSPELISLSQLIVAVDVHPVVFFFFMTLPVSSVYVDICE